MFFGYNVTLLLRGQNLGVDSHTKGDSSSNCKCLDILVRGEMASVGYKLIPGKGW